MSFARSSGRGDSLATPLSRSMAARANSSNVTMVDAGIARQSEENCFPRAAPNTSGCPGWISTRSKKNSAPRSASTRSTISYLPAETPPESTSRSEARPRSIKVRVDS